MSRHVAPHQWAELEAGHASAAARERAEAHAAGCAACRAERELVRSARAALGELGQAEPPTLPWDTMGAQVHWKISSELRRRARAGGERPSWLRRPLLLSAVGAALAAAGVGLWIAEGAGPGVAARAPGASPPAPVAPAPVAPAPVAPAPIAPLEGVVTLVTGQVTLDGAPLALDAAVRAGSRLVTGDGTVHVQFGERSGFVVAPRSVLEVVAFDERQVELRVEGGVGVEVSHRRDGQRFAVVAAGRRVEVRGTVFRVRGGDQGLDVAVTRGRVAVIDGADQVDVPAGMMLSVPLAAALEGHAARPMGDAQARALAAELEVVTIDGLGDAQSLRGRTGTVALTTAPGQVASVDGVALPRAAGAMRVRVAPGRHQVRVGGRDRWVQVELGAVAEIDAPATGGRISERAGQVEAELRRHHARLEVCAARAHAQDPELRAELVVELEIDADGNLRAVVPVKGLADTATETCLIDVIRGQFTFPRGSRDTVRKAIRL